MIHRRLCVSCRAVRPIRPIKGDYQETQPAPPF